MVKEVLFVLFHYVTCLCTFSEDYQAWDWKVRCLTISSSCPNCRLCKSCIALTHHIRLVYVPKPSVSEQFKNLIRKQSSWILKISLCGSYFVIKRKRWYSIFCFVQGLWSWSGSVLFCNLSKVEQWKIFIIGFSKNSTIFVWQLAFIFHFSLVFSYRDLSCNKDLTRQLPQSIGNLKKLLYL